MDRLTSKEHDVNMIVLCDSSPGIWDICKGENNVCKIHGFAADKLAAYEDTGLTPEEITAMKAEYEQRQKFREENEKLSKAGMNRKILEQVYYINRELKMWEHELERLKMRSPVASPTPRTGSGSSISDLTARIAERRIEIESYIKFKADQLQTARDEAMRLIWDIPDSLTRMIVFYRCVSLMSWRRVAYEVGGGNSEESVRQVYSRFMKKLSQMSQADVV